MRSFDLVQPKSYEEAAALLNQGAPGSVEAMAGGTDILNVYKQKILKEHPDKVLSLKNIPGTEGIEKEGKTIKVLANTKLTDIANSEELPDSLKQAAYSVATPLIRNMATIGGNICQDVRCWYYRYPHEAGGRMDCLRKGGETCYSIQGENRYHSIFGGMSCGMSPCQSGCPACTDIPGYMDKLRKGDIDGAARIILNANPLPMITGRVCVQLCRDNCNHNQYGESVSIRNVERFMGDYILDNADKFYIAPEKETGKKVAVIGGGPAGLSAAYHLRRAGNEVVVYEAMEEAGGMLMYAIPAYRLSKDIVRGAVKALEGMGIKFITNARVGDTVDASELEKEFDSVCFSTGAWKRPVLGLSGEELTVFGLDFLIQVHDWMEGKIGQEVLVTGGGSVAIDLAFTAKRLGASKVTMACLESLEEMPATAEEVARAIEEGIEIMPSWGLSKVVEENGKVTGMELVRCTSVRDAEGRFSPQYDQNEKLVVKADNILMGTGQTVDTSFLTENFALQLSRRGTIDVEDETQMTSRLGVFAAGDATTGTKTIILGIAKGKVAASGMNKYMGVEDAPALYEKEAGFITFDAEGVKAETGLKLRELAVEDRDIDTEDEFTPELEETLKEATRCMNCGCYSVNASDISPVLISLNGTIVTTKKEIPAERFFQTSLKVQDQLDRDELVTAVKFDVPEGYKTGYIKARIRPAIDFALESLAYAYKAEGGIIEDIRLVSGGVAPVPVRLTEVEEFLIGKTNSQENAEKAGALAVKNAVAMDKNGYKVNGLKAMVTRLVESI